MPAHEIPNLLRITSSLPVRGPGGIETLFRILPGAFALQVLPKRTRMLNNPTIKKLYTEETKVKSPLSCRQKPVLALSKPNLLRR